MSGEAAQLRHAVLAWRDVQVLEAHLLLNEAARKALEALEEALPGASIVDSAWDPAGFADRRVDRCLADQLGRALPEFLRAGARQLADLDPRFEGLARAFTEAVTLDLPLPGAEPAEPPGDETAATGSSAGAPAPSDAPPDAPPDEPDAWYWRIGGAVGGAVSSLAGLAGEHADWLVQDKAGLRNRIRNAAQDRVATAWMGHVGDPRPVLAQVLGAIDGLATEARIVVP